MNLRSFSHRNAGVVKTYEGFARNLPSLQNGQTIDLINSDSRFDIGIIKHRKLSPVAQVQFFQYAAEVISHCSLA